MSNSEQTFTNSKSIPSPVTSFLGISYHISNGVKVNKSGPSLPPTYYADDNDQCDGKSMFVFDTSTRRKKIAYDKDQVPPVRALTRIVYILSLVRKQAGRSYLRWGDFNRRERFPDSGKWWIGRRGRGCKGMMLKGTEVMLTMGRGKV